MAWDIAGRLGQTDIRGFRTEVHEIDYKMPQTVYEENGVTIKAFPAIHTIDGSVIYSLASSGLSSPIDTTIVGTLNSFISRPRSSCPRPNSVSALRWGLDRPLASCHPQS